jgi:N-terminal domain of anti-restriction factor ArdC
MPQTTPAPHAFSDLLAHALNKPGKIHEAYTAFQGYSIGNQLLALMQCHARGIEPGPLATFPRWKDRGRFVRKGQKALTLCMPITVTRKTDDPEDAEVFTRFIYRPRWFVLSQTDGPATTSPPPLDGTRPARSSSSRLPRSRSPALMATARDTRRAGPWPFPRSLPCRSRLCFTSSRTSF